MLRLARRVNTGPGLTECVTSDGFTMTVIADDYIGRHLILTGQHDRVFVSTLLAFGSRGDRCLDVGANIGYVAAVILATLADSRVDCVEPQPLVADLLRRNLMQFPPERWDILEAALSDVDADGILHINENNRGASSLVAAGNGPSSTVKMVPAGDYLSKFERLDLMKIDIEGHEETVMRSARGELARLHPKAILFEDHDGRSVPGGAIHAILDELDYDIYAIKKKLTGVQLVKVRDGLTGFDDFIAVSRRRPLPATANRLIG